MKINGRWLLFTATAVLGLLPRWGEAQACAIREVDADGNGTRDLMLIGAPTRQNAVVEIRNTGYLAQIDCNGNGVFTNPGDQTLSGTAEIESYIVQLGGLDQITIRLTEDLTGKMKHVFLNLTGATNKVRFTTQGFGIRSGTSLGLDLRGGAQADNVTLDFSGSTIEDSGILVRGQLAGGSNVFNVIGASMTIDSLLDVNVAIGSGYTLSAFNDGGGTWSNSALEYRIRGGDMVTTYDNVTDYFAGHYENSSRVHSWTNLLYGNDKYRGTFDPNAFGVDTQSPRGSELRFWVRGGVHFDTVRLLTDPAKTGAPIVNGLLSVDFDGGTQPDAAEINWQGLTGTGQLGLRVNQYSSVDKVTAAITTDAASQNDLWIYLNGGPIKGLGGLQGDLMQAILNEPGGHATYGPLGTAVVDSGLEQTDTCMVSGTMPYIALSCEKGQW